MINHLHFLSFNGFERSFKMVYIFNLSVVRHYYISFYFISPNYMSAIAKLEKYNCI